MDAFLLKKEPIEIVRISTALYTRIENSQWTGILEEETENFENVLKKVLEEVPLHDIKRREKLQSFSTGEALKIQVRCKHFIII
jgi:Fe-S cluster assembly ATPase SufC